MRQQILKRNTYTPTDAPQVRGNCDLALNMPEKASVPGLKTSNISPDVALREPAPVERKAYAFVLNATGKPLMPTSPAKARHLVKKGLAKVVKAYPLFVIKMQVQVRNAVQDVTLGIDPGYEYIGYSATTETTEFVCGAINLEWQTKERLYERLQHRKHRRARNHWYRKNRILNRRKNVMMPSVHRRYISHVNIINTIEHMLPICNINIETSIFYVTNNNNERIALIRNKGVASGIRHSSFRNRRCSICGTTKGPMNVHHKYFRSFGGSNAAKNLMLVCVSCHSKLHSSGCKSSVKNGFAAETQTMLICARLLRNIKNSKSVYAIDTKNRREQLGFSKEHFNDAFCIAGNLSAIRSEPILLKQKRRNNRKLQRNRDGFCRTVRRTRYSIQPNDIVWINKKKFITAGIHALGKRLLIAGKSIAVKNVTKCFHVSSIFRVRGF